MIELCINQAKLKRAQLVCSSPTLQMQSSAEARSFAKGQAEGLKGDDLIVYVYKAIGGLVLGDVGTIEGAEPQVAAVVMDNIEKSTNVKTRKKK